MVLIVIPYIRASSSKASALHAGGATSSAHALIACLAARLAPCDNIVTSRDACNLIVPQHPGEQ